MSETLNPTEAAAFVARQCRTRAATAFGFRRSAVVEWSGVGWSGVEWSGRFRLVAQELAPLLRVFGDDGMRCLFSEVSA